MLVPPATSAITSAIAVTAATVALPTQRSSLSDAFLRIVVLYMSDANELDDARSCESAVDIAAATIAASINPPMSATAPQLIILRTRTTNTCSLLLSISAPKYTRATSAITVVIIRISAIHTIPRICDRFISFSFLIAI